MPKSGEHNVNNIDSFFRVRPSRTNLREGETVSFLEDGKLVKQEKRNGVVYEIKLTELGKQDKVKSEKTTASSSSSSSSAGLISAITAGAGLTGGGTTGTVNLDVGAGTGITVSSNSVSIDSTVVTLTGTQTLTNKTLTSPIISSISNTGTLTLPTSTDTLVGRATTDTLSNKTLTSPTINTSLTFDSVALTAIQTSLEAFADNDTSIMTSAAIQDKILSYGYSTTTGTVTSVSGGNGLTGTITSSGSLNVGAGTHITVNADDVAVNTTTLFASPAFTGTATGVNLTLSGNLIVNGTTITIDTDTLAVQDPLIKLAKANSATDTVDIGFYGLYDTSGSQDLYAGLFRDADDSGKFKLFKDLQTEPTSTVNVLGTGYTTGTLVAALEGNASTATALETARTFTLTGEITAGGVSFDGTGNVSLSTAISAGVIEDGDIASDAAITITKLASSTISGVSLGGTLNTLTLSSPLSFTLGTSYTGAVTRNIELDVASINHDALANYVANEHIDWTAASAGTIHSSNYTDTSQATTFVIQDSGTPSNVTISQGKYVKFQALNNGGLDIQWASPLGAGSSGDPYDLQFQIDLGDLPAMAGSLSGTDNVAVYDSTEGTVLVTAQEIADLASAGLTYNGSTANGVLTYGSSTTIDVEQYLTFDGNSLLIRGDNNATKNIEIGYGTTGNNYAYIDLIGDTTYTDFGARFIRENTGPNTGTAIEHRGTGVLSLNAKDAGSVRFYTSNTERVRIDSSGNIGVGNIAPNEKLQINSNVSYDTKIRLGDNGTSRYFLAGMLDSNTGMIGYVNGSPSHLAFHTGTGATGSEKMRITTDGYVGIGTNSPNAALEIKDYFQIEASSTYMGILGFNRNVNTGAILNGSYGAYQLHNYQGKLYLQVYNSAGTAVDQNALVVDNSANVGIGIVPKTGGSTWQHIQFGGTGNLVARKSDTTIDSMFANNYYVNSSNVDSYITTGAAARMYLNDNEFNFDQAASGTADTAISFSTAMKIDSSGNVGIGTNSPQSKLHTVQTLDTVSNTLANGNYGLVVAGDVAGVATDTVGIHLAAKSVSGTPTRGASILAEVQSTGNNHDLIFATSAVSAAPAERMRITNAGNVGIGTTSPGAKMHIQNGATSYTWTPYGGTTAIFEGTSSNHSIVSIVGSTTGQSSIWFGDTDAQSVGRVRYENSTNNMEFWTNGTEKMTITSAGNVGIGTTSPSYLLHLSGTAPELAFTDTDGSKTWRTRAVTNNFHITETGAGDPFVIESGAGANAFKINSSGNVGIGIASPEGKVHIYNGDASVAPDSDGDELVVENSGDSGISILSGESSIHTGTLIFGSANDAFGAGLQYSYYNNSLKLMTANTGHSLIFSTDNNVEAMRIDSSQRVGIGTTSPSNKLEAYGTDAGLVVHYQGNSRGGIHALSTQRIALATTASADDLVFGYGGSPVTSAGFVERMRIDNSTGNVGIGTSSPGTKLEVKANGDTSQEVIKIRNSSGTEIMTIAAIDGNGDGYINFNSSPGTINTNGGDLILSPGGSGNVGIGTTSPSQKLHTNGTAGDTRTRTSTSNHGTYFESGVTSDSAGILLVAGHASSILNIYLQGSGGVSNEFQFQHDGDFHADGDVIAFSTTVSDKRLKDNVKVIDNALDKVMKLRGVEFDWNQGKRKGQHDLGLIAQEVEEVLPELVREKTLCTGEYEGNEQEFKTVDYEKIVGVLIEAVKEQQEQINKLEEKLNG